MQFGGARSVSGSRGDGGRRSQGAFAAVPGVDQVGCPAGLDLEQGAGAEEDVGGDLDVLVVEVGRLAVAAEPAQGVAVAAVGDRGGHLEGGEVADDRAAAAPV